MTIQRCACFDSKKSKLSRCAKVETLNEVENEDENWRSDSQILGEDGHDYQTSSAGAKT